LLRKSSLFYPFYPQSKRRDDALNTEEDSDHGVCIWQGHSLVIFIPFG